MPGRILIDDQDVTRLPVWERSQRVARVFQDPMAGNREDLTTRENRAGAASRQQPRPGRGSSQRCGEGFRERLASLGLGLENGW